MCNLYSHTSNRQAILDFIRDVAAVADNVGNLEPQTGIYPDYMAPIVRSQSPLGAAIQSIRTDAECEEARGQARSKRPDRRFRPIAENGAR